MTWWQKSCDPVRYRTVPYSIVHAAKRERTDDTIRRSRIDCEKSKLARLFKSKIEIMGNPDSPPNVTCDNDNKNLAIHHHQVDDSSETKQRYCQTHPDEDYDEV